ncbi:MAG: hypothetical protein ACRCYU_22635, partial [Nocardioides sp.]
VASSRSTGHVMMIGADEQRRLERLARELANSTDAAPVGLNPATSLVPTGEPRDYAGWARASARLSSQRARSAEFAKSRRLAPRSAVTLTEREAFGARGVNDTKPTAEPIRNFGTRPGASNQATLVGNQATVPDSAVVAIPPTRGDDDSPERARDIGVADRRLGISTTGAAADPPGPEVNDFDYYKLSLSGGELVRAEIARTSGDLEPYMVLVDQNLELIAAAEFGAPGNATLTKRAPAAGAYYLLTYNIDPTAGNYRLRVTAGRPDTDVWAVDLRAGDVLAASAGAEATITIAGSTGQERHTSEIDPSYLYPLDSPLPGGDGSPVTDYVAPADGRYYVAVANGVGPYRSTLRVYRYGGQNVSSTQTVFLDANGASLNTRIFSVGNGVVRLSPLSAFLANWGLAASQERALVARIKANLQENLDRDLAAAGLSKSVRVRVVSSFDGPDLTGRPGVTTMILGGTVAESGIFTIGLAESIDPGNFARTETGLVLMDALSEPAGESYSLNTYLRKSSDRVGFVAQALGNVTSHEVGHMIGNWHTDNENASVNLMDQGGNFGQLFGVGPDGIGGTADDRDVDFVIDAFAPFEGFFGREDSRARSTWGMSR